MENNDTPTPANNFENRIDLTEMKEITGKIKAEISKIIVGQNQMVELMLVALLSDGHILIEGVPGVAKTLTAKILAKTIDVKFNRIQFTPDLMPSDIIGTTVFNQKTADFEFHKGPLFANMVLIDEINRSPAKTQAALFEVMEEQQITVDGTTHLLPPPFMVMATQNPVEHEGTYRLPEAQLDRFLLKINVDYPTLEQETEILMRFHKNNDRLDLSMINTVITPAQLAKFKALAHQVIVENHLIEYIAKIVQQTRESADLFLGASPRASIAVLSCSKSYAAMQGRDFVSPEDIQYITPFVLKHRIIPTPEKEMEGIGNEEIIKDLIASVEVPR